MTLHFARYRVNVSVHSGRREAGGFVRLSAPPWDGGSETGVFDALDSVSILAPCRPTKLVCVGLNYEAHIAESVGLEPGREPPREPLLFFKPPSSVIASGESIPYPPGVSRLDPEAELAVVIGRRVRRVAESEAREAIAGVTCVNDVSARNYQKSDGQWARAKGFDGFAPLGPWIATGLDPDALGVECRVNGKIRQRGHTSDLRFPIPYLISFISHIMTLEAGDVIATGTPAGGAPIQVGDRVEVDVEGVGVLSNPVGSWN